MRSTARSFSSTSVGRPYGTGTRRCVSSELQPCARSSRSISRNSGLGWSTSWYVLAPSLFPDQLCLRFGSTWTDLGLYLLRCPFQIGSLKTMDSTWTHGILLALAQIAQSYAELSTPSSNDQRHKVRTALSVSSMPTGPASDFSPRLRSTRSSLLSWSSARPPSAPSPQTNNSLPPASSSPPPSHLHHSALPILTRSGGISRSYVSRAGTRRSTMASQPSGVQSVD
jgi:hypothetical protein